MRAMKKQIVRVEMFVLMCLVLLAGCGKERKLGIAERYVLAFESASVGAGHPVKVDNLVVEFTPTGHNFATCEERMFHTPKIIITQSHWNVASETQREIILFHELGHCVLGRNHFDLIKADGSPSSLMHSKAVLAHTYQRDRGSYVHELFHASR